jgi:hypothetical protein
MAASNPLIDIQLDRGTATNQVPVWNDATQRFVPSTTLSGLTFVSPIISGDFSWTGDSDWDCTDDDKVVRINASGEFTFLDANIVKWFQLDPGSNVISFGNATTNPAINFPGSGTVSMGGDAVVTGDLTVGATAFDVDSVNLTVGVGVTAGTNAALTARFLGENSTEDRSVFLFVAQEDDITTPDLDFSIMAGAYSLQNSSVDVANMFGLCLQLGTLGSTFTSDVANVAMFDSRIKLDGNSRTPNTYALTSHAYHHAVTKGASATLTTVASLYMEEETVGETNWQIFSVGGDNHFGSGTHDFVGITATQGRIKNTTRVTTTYQILATDDRIFCDTDSAGFTATLPASPTDGQTHRIINAGSNTLIIGRNSETIVGSALDVTLNAGDVIILTFETTEGWW